jgi:hypothetical protein
VAVAPATLAPGELAVEDGVGSVEFTAGAGVHRLSVAGDDLAATANPTAVDARRVADGESDGERGSDREEAGTRGGTGDAERNGDGRRHTYFGDPHGQSGETVGTGTVDGYFAYARDSAFVDFAAHAGNDFQITDELWERILATVRSYNDPGSFVTFPCYEWSANTPNGGDHNVYFRDDGDHEIHRSSRWLVTDDDDERAGGTYPVQALYDRFAGREDVLIVPHQGGRPATPSSCDPKLTPFVEIASVWGVFEWFGQEALDEGYRVGFAGGSDDHSGRPGATRPDTFRKHNLAGGLMGVQAPALTRAALWEAFRKRRVYATTGARIRLDARIAGTPMGAETGTETETGHTGPVAADVTVNGTAPVQAVDLFRGSERISGATFDRGPDRIEIRWRGARGTGRDKTIDWSGGVALDRGEITGATAVGIDRPTDGITVREPTAVRWTATTTGNHQAVRLAVDAPDDATLSVATEPATLDAALGDVDRDGRQVAAPGLDAALELRRVGAGGPRDVAPTLSDPEPLAGTHPYYVRVRQADGEMAWSSPTFVDCGD